MNFNAIILKDHSTVFIFYTQRNSIKATIRQIMDYRINQRERDALKGLPHLARLTYLEALRPYMDYATGVIGIKRGISYQSLTEELYVEPHPGYKSGSPSRQQMRRVLKSLERSGLISIQSASKKLVIKCELATWDYCEQKQVGTKPTHQANTKATGKNGLTTRIFNPSLQKADTPKTTQADTPPESGINIIFLEQEFEKFWSIYPIKQSHNKAWEAFKAISPTQAQLQTILDGLIKQVEHYNQAKAQGHWMPNWKHPNNWLAQQCWEDEILEPQGNDHARSERRHQATDSASLLWQSCKDSLQEYCEPEAPSDVIDFKKYRYGAH